MPHPSPPLLRAAFAAALSLLCPGWGHVYSGYPARGCMALGAVALIAVPALAIASATLGSAGAGTVGLCGAWLLCGALPLDAAQRAFSRRPPNGVAAVALSAVFALAGFAVLRAELSWLSDRFVAVYETPTPSMEPNLLPGDVYVVDVREDQPLEPGDVVIFETGPESTHYAKRMAATAGSWVELRDGRLIIDGEPRTALGGPDTRVEAAGGTPYAVRTRPGSAPLDFGPVLVPDGHVFVLGDNRGHSVDSRSFGPIRVGDIKGRALRVLWSREPGNGPPRWERIGLRIGSLASLR